jgi:hypothetical protein
MQSTLGAKVLNPPFPRQEFMDIPVRTSCTLYWCKFTFENVHMTCSYEKFNTSIDC